MPLNPPCPTVTPALFQANTTEKFRLHRSMYFSASPHSMQVPCKLNHDSGSSRSAHIDTLVQLAEMFRREELTYIARGALKKKGIFLQFFKKWYC